MYRYICYYKHVRQRRSEGDEHTARYERREDVENGMTNAEFNSFLETLAKLVEATAKDPKEAAKIIREAKTDKAEPKK